LPDAPLQVADGSGRLTLNRDQNVLDGTWTVTGGTPERLTLVRR